MHLENSVALITGASAGIGREFARQLAARSSTLVLIARRLDRLEELRSELIAQNPELQVILRATDLSDAAQVEALCGWLNEEPVRVDLLINNAGLGDHGSFSTSNPTRLMSMLAVNVTALTALTRALLPAMIERKRGAVLNVSSCASFLPMASLAAYAATKAYVTSLSEAIRMETRGNSVTVTALCPGPVHTEFGAMAARPDQSSRLGPEFTYVSTENVVRSALQGIEHDRAVVIPGMVMKIGIALLRLTPMPILRFVSRAQV